MKMKNESVTDCEDTGVKVTRKLSPSRDELIGLSEAAEGKTADYAADSDQQKEKRAGILRLARDVD